jgi:hypothetical protein
MVGLVVLDPVGEAASVDQMGVEVNDGPGLEVGDAAADCTDGAAADARRQGRGRGNGGGLGEEVLEMVFARHQRPHEAWIRPSTS